MKGKKQLGVLLILTMVLSLFPQGTFAAKKKVKLNKKSVTVNVGKAVKIKLQNNTKKVKWTIISGKKNVMLSNKAKTSVTIKGKKAGKAKVQAKAGRKKYVCKVTVKEMDAARNTAVPASTSESSAKNTTPSISTNSPQSSPNNTVKVTAVPTPANTPQVSPDNTKKMVSITKGNDYYFLRKGKKLVDKGNRNLEDDEVDISAYDLQCVDVKYADGSEEKDAHSEDITYDYSQINFNELGTYKLKIIWGDCSCEVSLVIAEEREEGLFSYLTDGNVAQLVQMGDLHNEESYHQDWYPSTTITIPETLGGAKVVQGQLEFLFSTDSIERIEFPRYYLGGFGRYSGYNFPKLKEISVSDSNTEYLVKDNVVFTADGEELLLYPGGLENTSYSIPEGVIEGDIRSNPYLKEITYPKSFMGMSLRRGWPTEMLAASCYGLEAINVAPENPYWESKDGVLYQKEEDGSLELVTYPKKKPETSFTVEENVDTIYYNALDKNCLLENITFKSPDTYIMDEALNGDCLKNLYLDFEEEDTDTDEIGLYLSGFKFYRDVADEGTPVNHPNIYIRSSVSLKHISEGLQKYVKYY